MKRSDDGKVRSTVPHGGTVTLTRADLERAVAGTCLVVHQMPINDKRKWTEADVAYVNAATTVEEGARRMCEVEDRIWYEIASEAVAKG